MGDKAITDEVLVDCEVGDGGVDLSFELVALPVRVEGRGPRGAEQEVKRGRSEDGSSRVAAAVGSMGASLPVSR